VVRVKYSDESIRDLEEIGDYIAEQLGSPKAALNTVSKIQDTIDRLNDFPLMGARLLSIVEIETDYRFLVCGNHLAFYRPMGEKILIDRILYGKRDYIAILFDALPRKEGDF